MNKGLLMIVAGLLVVACSKREINSSDDSQQTQVIALTSGAVLQRAANVGIRSQFEMGDQIAVMAIHAKDDGTGTDIADWSKPLFFENKPAGFLSNTVGQTVVTTFAWGGDASGGVEHNQYYPSKNAKIFLCSYYPFTEAAGKYIPYNAGGATDPERQPTLVFDILAGNVNVEVEGKVENVLIQQPDILHYAGVTAVSSSVPTSPFLYQHALAQVRFTIRRPNDSSPCFFKKLVFKTAKGGVLNLATGVVTCPTDADKLKDAIFTIQMLPSSILEQREVPQEGLDPKNPDFLDVLNPDAVDFFNYMMILPLTSSLAEQGELVLTCDFSEKGDDTDLLDMKIPLAGNIKNFLSGKLNTLAMTVSRFAISLTATIEPWGEGNTSELPAD